MSRQRNLQLFSVLELEKREREREREREQSISKLALNYNVCLYIIIVIMLNNDCCYSDENSYVLKVAGQNSYIRGPYELMEFAYVIRCLIKKTDIDLALVERVDPSIDRLRNIEDVSGIIF